ncbi:MAG: hypothetical protein PQJ58_15075 [Spirochaetales bacterium]|nr:hypothetical protein [Spirochaetales bacterium]
MTLERKDKQDLYNLIQQWAEAERRYYMAVASDGDLSVVVEECFKAMCDSRDKVLMKSQILNETESYDDLVIELRS